MFIQSSCKVNTFNYRLTYACVYMNMYACILLSNNITDPSWRTLECFVPEMQTICKKYQCTHARTHAHTHEHTQTLALIVAVPNKTNNLLNKCLFIFLCRSARINKSRQHMFYELHRAGADSYAILTGLLSLWPTQLSDAEGFWAVLSVWDVTTFPRGLFSAVSFYAVFD